MKFAKKTVLTSLLLLSTTSAFAAETADMTVTGTIAPGACTPSFSSGGTVDYGHIPTSSLSADAVTILADKQISYTINCDAPISVGYVFSDSRASSAYPVPGTSSGFLFGLGMQGAAKIGAYTLTQLPGSVTGDNVVVDPIYRDNSGNGLWASFTPGNILNGGRRTGSYAPVGTLVPGTYSTLSGTISVTATIAPTSDLDLAESITLDGLSTMTVRYL